MPTKKTSSKNRSNNGSNSKTDHSTSVKKKSSDSKKKNSGSSTKGKRSGNGSKQKKSNSTKATKKRSSTNSIKNKTARSVTNQTVSAKSKGEKNRTVKSKKNKDVTNKQERSQAERESKSTAKNTKINTTNKILIEDRVIPDAVFYKGLVLIMILFNLIGLGILIYNQYYVFDYGSPSTLTQIGGEGSYEVCMQYCERYAKPKEQDLNELVNLFTDETRGIQVRSDENVLVNENPEVNAYTFMFPENTCGLEINMVFIDPKNMPLLDWVEVNYPENEFSMIDDDLVNYDAYRVFTKTEQTSDTVVVDLGNEYIDLTYEYSEVSMNCSYFNDEFLFERFINSIEIIQQDQMDL